MIEAGTLNYAFLAVLVLSGFIFVYQAVEQRTENIVAVKFAYILFSAACFVLAVFYAAAIGII